MPTVYGLRKQLSLYYARLNKFEVTVNGEYRLKVESDPGLFAGGLLDA